MRVDTDFLNVREWGEKTVINFIKLIGIWDLVGISKKNIYGFLKKTKMYKEKLSGE